MKTPILFFCFSFFITLNNFVLKAQDPYFSQFFANRIYLNPAYAGFDSGVNLTLNYRDQWFGVPDASSTPTQAGYRTYNATVNWQTPCFDKLENNTFGLALSAFQDEAGAAPLSTTGFGLASSMGLRLIGAKTHRTVISEKLGITTSSHFRRLDLRVGFQFSLAQRQLESNRLIYSYQLDPVVGLLGDPSFLNIQSGIYGNLNVGVLLRGQISRDRYNETLFSIGFSLNNVTQPDVSLLDLASNVTLPKRSTFFLATTHRIASLRGPSGKNNRKNYWYISPQFRWDRQMDGNLNLQTLGFSALNRIHSGGIFVQYNFPNTPVTNSGLAGPLQARNTTTLILNYNIDMRNALNRRGSKSGLILGFTYDIPLEGVGTETALGVLELSLRMKLWEGGRSGHCLDLRKNELYNGECPWRY